MSIQFYPLDPVAAADRNRQFLVELLDQLDWLRREHPDKEALIAVAMEKFPPPASTYRLGTCAPGEVDRNFYICGT